MIYCKSYSNFYGSELTSVEERLQKYMSRCGIASRRKSEELILEGRVKVNNVIINELGFKVNSELDRVFVDNTLIKPVDQKIYIMLNKPEGVISSVKDDRNRKTVIDVIGIKEKIFPIGRLDYDTSGLLLLTNDGEVYNKIIHPRKEVNKIYIAKVKGIFSEEEIKAFENGVDIGDYVTARSKIKILKKYFDSCEVKITIHEGKNRQVRRMCSAFNHEVISLKRISIGEITLKDLEKGKWRNLSEKEIEYLKKL